MASRQGDRTSSTPNSYPGQCNQKSRKRKWSELGATHSAAQRIQRPGPRERCAQRSTICSEPSAYRCPCTVICEAASSISLRSPLVSSTAAAPTFSCRRWSFVVPGIGGLTPGPRRAREDSEADRIDSYIPYIHSGNAKRNVIIAGRFQARAFLRPMSPTGSVWFGRVFQAESFFYPVSDFFPQLQSTLPILRELKGFG